MAQKGSMSKQNGTEGAIWKAKANKISIGRKKIVRTSPKIKDQFLPSNILFG